MQQGGDSPLAAIAGPARLLHHTPKLGELFLTGEAGEKDVAGSSKVFPSQNMTSLTRTEYLRLVKNLLQSNGVRSSPPQIHFEDLQHNSEHDQYFPPVVTKKHIAGNEEK